jgi:hypothetical protein
MLIPWLHSATNRAPAPELRRSHQCLQDSYDERVNGLVMLKALPLFDPWRFDPVYQEIVPKMGLP